MANDVSYDVAIVGAGVVGSAAARELSSTHDVIAIDKSDIGGRASGMAAGLTSPTLFAFDNPPIAKYANNFFRDFSGTEEFEYNPRSRVELVAPDRVESAQDQAERMASNGFPVSFVEPSVLESQFALLDLDRFGGAIVIKDAGFVDDTFEYTCALARDAERQGAEFRTNAEVTDIQVQDGEVVGLETASGSITADTVVVAAGWRARPLLEDIVSVPLRPFLLQSASINVNRTIENDFPLGRLPAEDMYFRPQNDGRLRVGGGEFLVDDPENYPEGIADVESGSSQIERSELSTAETVNNGINSEFEDRIKDTLPLFVDGIKDPSEIDIFSGWRSLDAATADGEPIIDSVNKGPSGLILATGFNGLGITKSPVAGAGVRALVTGEEIPFSLDQYSLERLPDSTDFGLQDTFMMGN